MDERMNFVRHPEDRTIDEILFCGALPTTHEEAVAGAFLRLGIRERYKTSGMSGDEWRFSTVLQTRMLPTDEWEDTSGGYRDLECHAAALYPELYGDFRAGKNLAFLRSTQNRTEPNDPVVLILGAPEGGPSGGDR